VAKIDKNGKVLNVTGLPGSQPFPEFTLVARLRDERELLDVFRVPVDFASRVKLFAQSLV
jgi:hypothetical protein